MHPYDEFIEGMLRTRWEQCDARQSFAASPRFLWKFGRFETNQIVDTIYARGAYDVRLALAVCGSWLLAAFIGTTREGLFFWRKRS